MRLPTTLQPSSGLRIGLILLAVVAAVAAGASSLIYPSLYAPLVVGTVVAAAAILGFWVRKPTRVLFATIFVVFLPIGLVPPHVHSYVNRSMTMLAFGVWLLDVITRGRRVLWTRTALLMLGFLTWSTLTLLWTTNLSASTTLLQTYALRLVLFLLLVPNLVRTPDDLDGLMNTLALAGGVLVLTSVSTVLFRGYAPGTRLSVLDVNENAMGILTLIALSGVLWQATRRSKRHERLKILLAIVFMSLSMALTATSGSRGSALSFFVVICAFWVWKPTRRWATAGLLILVVAAISVPFIFSTTIDRFAGQPGDTLLGGREALWQAAWTLIRAHPWRGVGIGSAPHAVMPHVRMLRGIAERERAAIHNPVLTIWAETGIPGILLYLGVLGSAVWSFARQYRRHRMAGSERLIPYFALVASLFLGFLPSWIKGGGMESNHAYFLMLALLVIPCCLETEGLGDNGRGGAQAAERSPSEADAVGLPPRVRG